VNTVKQGEFRILASVPENELLDEKLIEQCATFQQALGVSRAMARRKLADGVIADGLGMQRSVWSRICHKPANSPAFMPEDKFADLCGLLGNLGVIQWLAYRTGHRLVPIAETRAQRLRRELAELELAEAA
jgi:hypothetical protein